jgi:anti-sigma factor ChrR (cupin superfamily)
MSRVRTTLIAFICAISIASAMVHAQTPKKAAPADKPAMAKAPVAKHVAIAPGDIKWGPAPATLPAGAQMAVLDGDPSKPVPFVIRAKFPDGYRVSPHWHPTDENVAVLSGTFLVGMGDAFDEKSMTALAAGGYAHMPKRMHHFALSKGETVIQVHGVGPFVVNYVNPADDPSKKK